jgi:hypothetical protein
MPLYTLVSLSMLRNWLVKFSPLIVIFLIVFVLFLTNYQPGTWLSGWDTLHPEFNLNLYLRRALWGSWMEHQGLGAAPAQAHASELTRLPVLFLLSLVLPLNVVRYAFFFICLFIGSIGVYFFVNDITGNRKASFLASLVYLLNLVVVQQFIVPLEMFVVHFASLPWLFLTIHNYMRKPDFRWLLLLSFVSLLSSSMAHTATLFYVTYGAIGLSLAVWVISHANFRKNVISSAIVLVSILIVNSFWLLPNFYFIQNYSYNVTNSDIHANFSQEAFLHSKSFGNLNNVILQRNFLFNWRVFDFENDKFVDLLKEWRFHYSDQFAVKIVVYFIFGVSILGVGHELIKKKSRALWILPVLVSALFFLINENYIFSGLYSFLRDKNSLFREGLRFPFTKFSILYVFALSVFFGLGMQFLLRRIHRKGLAVFFVAMCIVWSVWPMFRGQLIHPTMKTKIPNEYFELFDWLSNVDPDKRIAKLPLHTFWGWNYYDWGYQGAGFTWFGIQQPTLDREFDRWGSLNEKFYREISFALYSNDQKLFEEVLDKYNVSYLLWDKSVVNPGSDNSILYSDTIGSWLNSEHINHEKDFGKIVSLYKTDFDTGEKFLLSSEKIAAKVNISNSEYLMFNDLNEKNEIEIEDKNDFVSLKKELSGQANNGRVLIPAWPPREGKTPLNVSFYQNGDSVFLNSRVLPISLFVNEKEIFSSTFENRELVLGSGLEGNIEYINLGGNLIKPNQESGILLNLNNSILAQMFGGQYVDRRDIVENVFKSNPRDCSLPESKNLLQNDGINFNLTTLPGAVCLGSLFEVSEDSVVEIMFDTSSLEGLSPEFCITKVNESGCVNNESKKTVNIFGGSKKVSLTVFLGAGEYWLDFVARGSNDKVGSINYGNISFVQWAKLAESNLNFGFESNSEKIVQIEKFDNVELRYPKIVLAQEQMALGRGYPGGSNCDIDKIGLIKKVVLQNEISYIAEDGGVNCDYFDFGQIDINDNNLLHIGGENKEGRSVKLYLYNHQNKRIDVEKILSENVIDDYFVLPLQNWPGKGYTLNLETRAFGRVNAENTLNEIEFLYLPSEWIKSVKVLHDNTIEASSVELQNINKYSPTQYEVDVEVKGDWGVVVLSQGFEKGWRARIGEKELEHFEFDSWSNGWLVPKGEHWLTIDYTPQNYEWMGIALTTGYFLFLGFGGLLKLYGGKKI